MAKWYFIDVYYGNRMKMEAEVFLIRIMVHSFIISVKVKCVSHVKDDFVGFIVYHTNTLFVWSYLGVKVEFHLLQKTQLIINQPSLFIYCN